MTERQRVALVFGGASSEHAVSCLTAASVASAIDQEKYEVVGVGITPSGRWVRFDHDAMTSLALDGKNLPAVGEDAPDAVLLKSSGGAQIATRADRALDELGEIDVAFALLHGPFGEDGTIQGLFEMNGIPYVGSGVLASAVGMDKNYMKLVLSAAGVSVGPFVTIPPREWAKDRNACLESVNALTFPVFVKPCRGGSSLGITKVADPADLPKAIEFAQKYDPKVIIEQGLVDARELECGVLETPDGPRASVVAEIRVHSNDGVYDFATKYLPGDQVDIDVPAELPQDVTERVQALSIKVFDTLGCEGLARVDFFLTGENHLVCNEINTMPGFTATSMYPQLWSASGVNYPELIDTLIQQAIGRRPGLR
ncbi:D-alanine--D-alanine ligase family protein [Propionibacteriaceae bacterium Y1685]|uniref:D-alanine--D-alanine ligase family protein n=1 Tax=Microlunatus sp. Y1700 TaxID=3418487 RepID=UPI003B79F135